MWVWAVTDFETMSHHRGKEEREKEKGEKMKLGWKKGSSGQICRLGWFLWEPRIWTQSALQIHETLYSFWKSCNTSWPVYMGKIFFKKNITSKAVSTLIRNWQVWRHKNLNWLTASNLIYWMCNVPFLYRPTYKLPVRWMKIFKSIKKRMPKLGNIEECSWHAQHLKSRFVSFKSFFFPKIVSFFFPSPLAQWNSSVKSSKYPAFSLTFHPEHKWPVSAAAFWVWNPLGHVFGRRTSTAILDYKASLSLGMSSHPLCCTRPAWALSLSLSRVKSLCPE